MKKLLFLCLIPGITLLSCKKQANPVTTDTSTVTIDGTAYTTVKIDTQTWTSVNYNGTGGVNYNNGANDANNGKLYTRAEAKAVSLPTGWRVPTQTDYARLMNSMGVAVIDSTFGGQGQASAAIANKLMAKTGWTFVKGSNSSGFNGIPVGCYHHNTFMDAGTDAVFITTLNIYNGPQLGTANAAASFDIFSYSVVGSDNGAMIDDAVAEYTADKASLRFVKDN